MSRFRKTEKKKVPSLNTASLPDLIFTLLFFFMIVTNLRDQEPKMKFQLPDATESQKLEERKLTLFIYIGSPDPQYMKNADGKTYIQVDNDLIEISELKKHIENKRATLNTEDQSRLSASLKIDKNVKMGLVTDVKNILRDSQVLTVNYITAAKNEN